MVIVIKISIFHVPQNVLQKNLNSATFLRRHTSTFTAARRTVVKGYVPLLVVVGIVHATPGVNVTDPLDSPAIVQQIRPRVRVGCLLA